MRRPVVLLLLFWSVTRAAWAALGDSADKVEETYGTLVQRHLRDDGAVEVLYQKGRYFFRVTFKRAVSVAEEYSRADHASLSEKEVARFLKMNVGRAFTLEREATSVKVQIKK